MSSNLDSSCVFVYQKRWFVSCKQYTRENFKIKPSLVQTFNFAHHLSYCFVNASFAEVNLFFSVLDADIKLGALVEARGSCYLEMGKTKVLCGVSGPKEIPYLQLSGYTELGSIECNVESFPPAQSDKAYSNALKRALEPSVCRVSTQLNQTFFINLKKKTIVMQISV